MNTCTKFEIDISDSFCVKKSRVLLEHQECKLNNYRGWNSFNYPGVIAQRISLLFSEINVTQFLLTLTYNRDGIFSYNLEIRYNIEFTTRHLNHALESRDAR